MSFVESKASEAVDLLKTALVKKDGRDKRRAERTEIKTTLNITVMTDLKAELKDLSARGACLMVRTPLPDNAQFTLQLPSRPGTVRSPVICRVVHCKKQNDGWFQIGAEFIGKVPTNTLGLDAEETSDRIRDSILK